MLHALMDIPVASYQFGILTNIAIVEVILFVVAVGTAAVAYRIYKSYAKLPDTEHV